MGSTNYKKKAIQNIKDTNTPAVCTDALITDLTTDQAIIEFLGAKLDELLTSFLDKYNFKCITDLKPAQFTALIQYIYYVFFKHNRQLLIGTDQAHGFRVNVVNELADFYILIGNIAQANICLQGFCDLLGCEIESFYNWSFGTSDRVKIYKKITAQHEQAKNNKCWSVGGIPLVYYFNKEDAANALHDTISNITTEQIVSQIVPEITHNSTEQEAENSTLNCVSDTHNLKVPIYKGLTDF